MVCQLLGSAEKRSPLYGAGFATPSELTNFPGFSASCSAGCQPKGRAHQCELNPTLNPPKASRQASTHHAQHGGPAVKENSYRVMLRIGCGPGPKGIRHPCSRRAHALANPLRSALHEYISRASILPAALARTWPTDRPPDGGNFRTRRMSRCRSFPPSSASSTR